jgi:hypothetical protein
MNEVEALKNSPGRPYDFMQLEAGSTGNEITTLNGIGLFRKDFNASATKVVITGQKFNRTSERYEASAEHTVYLMTERLSDDPAPATNYGWPLVRYGTHQPPGPATSASVADNVKWAMRDLILRCKTAKTVRIKRVGLGDTDYGLAPEWKTSVSDVLDGYGPASPPYGRLIQSYQYEGRYSGRYAWPRLATKTARH